ncbi:MAG TPA: aminodeoxychorismate synthase component I [Gammaproteobacteria bacterium]|nr:aminodeoxychorismate synthase component I [Gammaproteobacteria bacterium]MDP6734442.1 aminodeoxychorismate synthase component I [Gammaproteobacteria bacterium]HAJ75663.1 aminodeoxychorismate synthase component I [Gammaproteobacteria bacterium]
MIKDPLSPEAIIRNEADNGWLRFSDPIRVVEAHALCDVIPALDEIEAACADGLTAVGWIAYEAAPAFDASLSCKCSRLPLLLFGIYDSALPWELAPAKNLALELSPQLTKTSYAAKLGKIKQLLQSGDSYQVNLTHQLTGECEHDGETVFASMYRNQPAAGSVFMNWGSHALCSVSPELFFSLDGRQIRMQPMKGTRPRGATVKEDQRLYSDLQTSEKERAENLMIVDMIRNDLSRIAHSGSVAVDELFQIVDLPTVWQKISTVSAQTSASLAEIFSALFPCSSITGAPKARTMAIIESLESAPRGIYTGAVGVIRPDRKIRFQVAIRSLLLDTKTRIAKYGVGSGIVWDSDVESEWQETMVKAKVVTDAPAEFCLLETMRFEPASGVLRLDHHMHRVQDSAAFFGFSIDTTAIRSALTGFIAVTDRKLRLLVSRDGSFVLENHDPGVEGQPMRLCVAQQAVQSNDVFLRHKTTNRQVYEMSREQLNGCDDVILWNERGELTETTICNLYLELGGELLTPDSSSGLLKGTYRQQLLNSGKARQAVLTREDLNQATRLFVSNSVRGFCEARLWGSE